MVNIQRLFQVVNFFPFLKSAEREGGRPEALCSVRTVSNLEQAPTDSTAVSLLGLLQISHPQMQKGHTCLQPHHTRQP